MPIVCPNCATSYNVDAASLGVSGRSVRCVRCRTVWQAYPQDLAPGIAQRPSEAPVAARAAPQLVRVNQEQAPDPAETDAPPSRDDVYAEDAPAPRDDSPVAEPSADELPPLVAEAPPLVPTDLDDGRQPDISLDPPIPEDIEAVAARRAARMRRTRKRRIGMPSAMFVIFALVVVHLALIAFRADVVRAVPQTASLFAAVGLPVNLRGLDFFDLKTIREVHDGVSVLAVEGAIINSAKKTADIPRLRFSVRNEAGQEIYSWTALPTKTSLAAGETLPFRSRLASPPPEGREVVVRFFTRRDMVAGFQ